MSILFALAAVLVPVLVDPSTGVVLDNLASLVKLLAELVRLLATVLVLVQTARRMR